MSDKMKRHGWQAPRTGGYAPEPSQTPIGPPAPTPSAAAPTRDNVNHPSHYTAAPDGVRGECIDYTRMLGFSQGNAFKYLYRAGAKGGRDQAIEDLAKARWYLQDWDTHFEATGNHSIGTPNIDPAASLRASALYLIAKGMPGGALGHLECFGDELIEEVTA